ncbi:hypothetical protein [Ferruginibacter albus]|uniref:hypothetical protein n=1 Tax=Ferruginibacter albus TaxID=2875540 RepID=UPI001CC71FC0|nr:hypothetical protein [Ferruginibacter albus]UAY52679.1 hypothetical protein K9M53_03050 [Ferruginibacter albus]
MNKLRSISLLFSFIAVFSNAKAQDNDWPRTINTQDGSVIKIYEPDPESFSGNTLKTRSAISLLQSGKTDPVFGTFWAVETVETDRDNRLINIISAKVPNIKFSSSDVDANTISYLKTALETQIPSIVPSLPQDEILAAIDNNTEEKKLSKDLSNDPPTIIYANKPSMLVVIDGEPKLQHNDQWGLDAVVNTPYAIVKNTDSYYYLYGGKHWYKGSSASGPFTYVSRTPANLNTVQTAIDNANSDDAGYSDSSSDITPAVIVSTVPAELIQTNGNPSFSDIDGTSLSYANNSSNDIFLDKSSQQYYVLISGRWYKSAKLNTGWQYVASNALPADFANIPEGSPKDNVLASVAGTNAAREAVMDAQIPQTAKVDRNTASANVTYDGDPQFDNIQGTDMQYATNTQSSVIRYRDKYYCVDNGVWFESGSPAGPWVVSVDRPDEVDIIPPSCPVYNIKYVYVYDYTPDWVYMGYTPGYLNTFIYGPTVVYGTGFHYRPWWGNYYYARPYTWGFGVRYNPWVGWSIGYSFNYGWFNVGFGTGGWNRWRGGWWGPSVYRPPYIRTSNRSYGYYGRRPAGIQNRPAVVNNRTRVSNNIYNFRRDVVTRNNNVFNPNNRIARRTTINNRPANINNRPATTINNRPTTTINNGSNNRPQQNNPNRNGTPRVNNNNNTQPNIQTDRDGNVYRRDNTTPNTNSQQWQQRQQNQWRNVDNNTTNRTTIDNLNRQQQMRERGQQRVQNFQQQRTTPGGGGGISRPSNNRVGGGGRTSGGGNRGNGGGGRRR